MTSSWRFICSWHKLRERKNYAVKMNFSFTKSVHWMIVKYTRNSFSFQWNRNWSYVAQKYVQTIYKSTRKYINPCEFHLDVQQNISWWRHQMETFSALLALCDAELWCFLWSKRLSKQSWGWCFETPSHPLWRHCNVLIISYQLIKVEWHLYMSIK